MKCPKCGNLTAIVKARCKVEPTMEELGDVIEQRKKLDIQPQCVECFQKTKEELTNE